MEKKEFIMSQEKIDFIQKNYKKLGLKRTAEILGCNQSTVGKYAKRLGLTKETILWSLEEDNFLRKHWSEFTPKEISLKMKKEFNKTRTECAIIKRAKDLKIKNIESEYLSSKDIEDILHSSHTRVNTLFNRNYIKYTIYKKKRRVEYNDFVDFLKKHQNLWHCSNVDLTFIKSICTSVSIRKKEDVYKIDDWLLKKIEEDNIRKVKEKKNWTTKEVEFAKRLLDKGNSIKEIATKLNRGYASVYDKLIYSYYRSIF